MTSDMEMRPEVYDHTISHILSRFKFPSEFVSSNLPGASPCVMTMTATTSLSPKPSSNLPSSTPSNLVSVSPPTMVHADRGSTSRYCSSQQGWKFWSLGACFRFDYKRLDHGHFRKRCRMVHEGIGGGNSIFKADRLVTGARNMHSSTHMSRKPRRISAGSPNLTDRMILHLEKGRDDG